MPEDPERQIHRPRARALLPRGVTAWARLLLLALWVWTSGASASQGAEGLRVVRFGVTEHPPVFFRDSSGEAAGFLPDLLREIAKRQNWKVQFVFAHGDKLVKMLQAGKLDLLSMAPTPRLEERFDFGKEPVFSTWYTFYTLPNRSLSSFQDLGGKRIGIQGGFYALVELTEILRQTKTDARILTYPTMREAFRALLEGKVDACAAEQLTSLGDTRELSLRRSPLVFAPARIFFGTTKGKNADLLQALDRELHALRETPGSTYDRLRSRWFYDENLTFFPRWGLSLLLGAGGLILLLIALIALWHKKDQRIRRQGQLLAQTLAFEQTLAACARDLLARTAPDTLERICRHLQEAAGAQNLMVCQWKAQGEEDSPQPPLRTVTVATSGSTPPPFPTCPFSVAGPEDEASQGLSLRFPLNASGSCLCVRFAPSPCGTEEPPIPPALENFLAAGASLIDLFLLRRDMEEQLLHQAQTDPLTGATNRRAFFEAVAREMHRSRRYGVPLSLVVLDVDLFKRVNDRFGHDAGDMVLQRLVIAARNTLRQEDVLGRLGGEEFGVLLPETPLKEACAAAERVRMAVENLRPLPSAPCPAGKGTEPRVTASFGVASHRPEKDEDVQSLYRRADKNLYRAKAAGRNRIVWDPEPSAPKSPSPKH